MKLPEDFINYMEGVIPDRIDTFREAMDSPPEVSVKLNHRKSKDCESIGFTEAEPVKWCSSGYYLRERPIFTLNPLLHAGVFYVQDASSMIYETIVERIVPMALDTGHPPVVLDLCAAPGGKTTSMVNALPDNAFVVANEYVPARAKALRENLIKWGFPNFIVTNAAVDRLSGCGPAFDIVAVDAPCSGEGMMRKDEMARQQWSPRLIESCAKLQTEITDAAIEMLKPGGFMIYSTCTFNLRENEDQVRRLVEEKGLVAFDPGFPEEWGILPGIDTPYPCFRFMPDSTRGEGLFVAVFRKEIDEYEKPVGLRSLLQWLRKNVKIIADGIPMDQLKGRDRIPTSESVLSTSFRRGQFSEFEADLDSAIAYLRHEAIRLPDDTPHGLVVITYKGVPLGLVKNIGNRANNLYPAEWKIRMSPGK